MTELFDFAAYCVVADESVGRQVPMAFLERIKDDFVSRYGSGKADTATANSLNKEFGYCILIKITGIHAGRFCLLIVADLVYYSLQAKIEGTHAILC